MGPLLVVLLAPGRDDLATVLQAGEPVIIQALVAITNDSTV